MTADERADPRAEVEPETGEPEPRSVMADLLAESLTADEVSRLEVAPGRWYLPGTPP